MELIKCPWCEKTISDENTRCPLCRRPLDAKPSDIAFFHATQQKDQAYRQARRAEEAELEPSWPSAPTEKEEKKRVYTGATEYCRFCGERIPEKSKVCPFCDNRLRRSKLPLVLLMIALIALAYFLGGR